MGLLDGEISDIVAGALDFLFLDATLTREVATPGPNAATPGVPTTVPYACKAIQEEWSSGLLSQGLVKAGDVRVLIIAGSLAVTPQAGDTIAIPAKGISATIVPPDGGQPAVSVDPANAVWVCRAK